MLRIVSYMLMILCCILESGMNMSPWFEKCFERLDKGNFTVSFSETEFVKAHVVYFLHCRTRKSAAGWCKGWKYSGISHSFKCNALLRFLGITVYYRRFCKKFSTCIPLARLLSKKVKYVWDENCNDAFAKIEQMLISATP